MCGSNAAILQTMPSNGKRSAVHKVADVLRAVVGSRARSLTAISAAAGLPLSTAHRIVTELVESDLLWRTDEGHYLLHESMVLPQTGRHDAGYSGSFPWGAIIAVLDDLTLVTQRIARLGWRQDDGVRYVERIPRRADVNPHERNDERPLYTSAMGKVLLAFTTPSVADTAHAAGTAGANVDGLPEQLARTRRTLVAYGSVEVDRHASTVAVPVFGGARIPVMALEIQTIDDRDSRRVEHATQVAARSMRRVLFTASGRDNRV